MSSKYFCYVDETGLDTRGTLFVVSVVVAEGDKNSLQKICELIERDSKKGQRKWTKTTFERKLAYIHKVLEHPEFAGRLSFAAYYNSQEYINLTTQTIASALRLLGDSDYKATIFIDGLPRSLEQVIGLNLRQLGVPAKKVRGVKKDENDALIRLADAVCGFARAALEGQPEMQTLFEWSLKKGIVIDLIKK